jgi:nucleoside-diphosphate-sugar epimerase
MEVKMKRILITGAGGFIGSHLAWEFYRQGHFVRVVDIKWDGYIEEPYYSEKLTLDLREKENCLKITKDIDFVFNLAANMGGIGFITSVGAEVMYDNVLINVNMLQASVENKVKKFFFSSSACIYPTFRQTDPNVTALKEEDAYPADPDNFYGWEKLYTEKMCEAFKKDYGLDIRIARYHNVYGPEGTYKGGREKAPAAICRKVATAKLKGENFIEVWGDGSAIRNYIYVDDLVSGVYILMQSDIQEPVNIGTEEYISIKELVNMAFEIAGVKLNIKWIPGPVGVQARNFSHEKMYSLGWKPRYTIKEGLEITYKWIEEQVRKG